MVFPKESGAEGILISKAQSGNREAFETLLNRYLKIIYNYTASRISSDEDRKDIVQETMLSVWTAIKSFDGNSTFRTWVLGITRRKIADFYRLSYRTPSVSITDFEDTLIADDDYDAVLDKTVTDSALPVLNEAEKELVFLVFGAELSYGEISELTGLPVGTIKSRMSAVKAKLRKKIEGE